MTYFDSSVAKIGLYETHGRTITQLTQKSGANVGVPPVADPRRVPSARLNPLDFSRCRGQPENWYRSPESSGDIRYMNLLGPENGEHRGVPPAPGSARLI